jgi:hypothetical protein
MNLKNLEIQGDLHYSKTHNYWILVKLHSCKIYICLICICRVIAVPNKTPKTTLNVMTECLTFILIFWRSLVYFLAWRLTILRFSWLSSVHPGRYWCKEKLSCYMPQMCLVKRRCNSVLLVLDLGTRWG